MKILIIDSHNLLFRNICAVSAECNNEKIIDNNVIFSRYKSQMMFSIDNYIKKFSPDRVIFAIDSFHLWRKDFYKLYKATRAAGREESIIDFKSFFPVHDKFFNELMTLLPMIYFLDVYGCEGDDIVGILTEYFKNDEIIAISTDKDMHQNFKYKNYKQWNPIKKDYVKVLNPIKLLEIKILTGDKGDNIPDVMNDALGAKIVTAEKLNKNLEMYLEDKNNTQIKERYLRNQTLIDTTKIPDEYKQSIIRSFKEYPFSQQINGRKLTTWCIENAPNFLDFMSDFMLKLKKLS